MSKAARRRWGIWIFVVCGGLLQYAYTTTRHPPVALEIWAATYVAGGIVVLILSAAWLGVRAREHLVQRKL